MTRPCRCAPGAGRCGRCDEPQDDVISDIQRGLADYERAENAEGWSPRRDDQEWAERVRRYVSANGR